MKIHSAEVAPNPTLVVDFHAERITAVLGVKTIHVGDINSQEGILVLGVVDGNIRGGNGTAMVGAGGIIRGMVMGNRVVIAGTVHGDVFAMDTLILADSAQIHGNVYYKNISIKGDATIDGRLTKIHD